LTPGEVVARGLFPLSERLEGRRIREKLARLRAEQAEPAAARRARQAERLAAIVRHAAAHVPHYRELFRRERIDPEAVTRQPERFAELPTQDKETIVAAGPRLLDERLDPATLHRRRTGGSTGPAVAIFYSGEALDWTAAVNLFVRERAGKPHGASEAHLSTAPGVPIPWRDRAREALKCAAHNRTNLPLSGLDEAALEGLRRALARVRPALLQGHPSTVHALACHVRERGGEGRPLFGLFESTGETLEPGARKTIADALGCRVMDRYGSAEFGVVACERPSAARPGLEILDTVVHAEALPHEGGSDELVLTGLLNPAMPLLRYRTGDLVRLAREADEVEGRIVAIQGRVHDSLLLAGRPTPTHVIQDRLDRLGCVEEFQIEVGGPRVPLLRVAAPERERERVRRSVRDWWGDALELEFAERAGFVRSGWRGKFRHLVARPERPTGVRPGDPA
jgi:phenylacetate-CoA ligase